MPPFFRLLSTVFKAFSPLDAPPLSLARAGFGLAEASHMHNNAVGVAGKGRAADDIAAADGAEPVLVNGDSARLELQQLLVHL